MNSTSFNLTLSNPNPVSCPTGSSCGCPVSQPTCALDKSAYPFPQRKCMNMVGPYIPSMYNNKGGDCASGANCGTNETCVRNKCTTKYSNFPSMG